MKSCTNAIFMRVLMKIQQSIKGILHTKETITQWDPHQKTICPLTYFWWDVGELVCNSFWLKKSALSGDMRNNMHYEDCVFMPCKNSKGQGPVVQS